MPAALDDPFATVALFAELEPAERAEIARRARIRRVHAGERLLTRDDPGREVLFLLEGRLDVVEHAPGGREIVLASVEPGGHVGELAALDGGPRTASVVAATDGRIATLDAASFGHVVEHYPQVALQLLRELVRIVRLSNLRTVELAGTRVIARLARELLRLARDEDGRWVVRPMPTQEELAARLATTRESIARAMSQLARSCLTRRSGRTLRILDRDCLEAIAGSGSPFPDKIISSP